MQYQVTAIGTWNKRVVEFPRRGDDPTNREAAYEVYSHYKKLLDEEMIDGIEWSEDGVICDPDAQSATPKEEEQAEVSEPVVIEAEVKPFSTADVVVALEWGHVIDREFQSKGLVYKHPGIMALTKRTREGVFGKPSFAEQYSIKLPANAKLAIAAKRRTGGNTRKPEMVYDLLFVPESER